MLFLFCHFSLRYTEKFIHSEGSMMLFHEYIPVFQSSLDAIVNTVCNDPSGLKFRLVRLGSFLRTTSSGPFMPYNTLNAYTASILSQGVCMQFHIWQRRGSCFEDRWYNRIPAKSSKITWRKRLCVVLSCRVSFWSEWTKIRSNPSVMITEWTSSELVGAQTILGGFKCGPYGCYQWIIAVDFEMTPWG